MDKKFNERNVFLFPTAVIIFISSLISLLIMAKPSFSDSKIKHPNVSGQFYSADPKELSADIDQFLSQAKVSPSDKNVEILIAPHAGYVYSGPIAAYSFKAVREQKYKTIVILAPDHFFGFDGISVWDEGGFETPLGMVEVDQDFAKRLTSFNTNVSFEPRAFAKEHSLEVEIPFLQKTFKDFKIVPVVMGRPSAQLLKDFAAKLHEIIGMRDDVLIVVSTDLSHYHPDDVARKMDQQALQLVKDFDVDKVWQGNQSRTIEMCGFIPVTAALLYAKLHGINKAEFLRYGNSGDVTGDKSTVVGYGSMIMYRDNNLESQENAELLNLKQKKRLLEIARQTIVEFISHGKKLDFVENDPRLQNKEGAFVTIHKHGNLRGCIGHIIADGPLYKTVRDMAISSATQDPRFKPVVKEDLKDLELEISVLSVPHLAKNADEIIMGKHGVIVKRGNNQGIFLPQVATETGWTRDRFLSELCSQKAGLPADCWKDPKTEIYIFSAQVFSEKDVQ